MGWTLLILGISLACVTAAIMAVPRVTAPARHARHARGGGARRGQARRGRTKRGESRRDGHGDLSAMAQRMHVLRRPAGVLHRGDDDPFEVLALQCRLTALAAEIQRLERDRTTIALAHHLRATQYAYDALLAEACHLVGLPDDLPAPAIPGTIPASWIVDEDTRMRKELELSARGWTW